MADEAITDSAGLNGPVTEAPAPRKRSVGTRATKKAAKETEAVSNVNIEEAGIGEVTTNVISAPNKAHTDGPVNSNTGTTANGVIGSKAADRVFEKPAVAEKKDDENKVAVWSVKNIRWTGVGALSKGYNIVTKEAADKWTTLNGIRLATPEEVASYYGK